MLETWRTWMIAQGLSERTITDRIYTLNHFFKTTGARPLTITPDDIIGYIGRNGLSQSSRSSYHRQIRAYCAWLVATGRRDDDPIDKTPSPKQPRGFPRPVAAGDLPLILHAANRRRTRMMVLLASLQGLRVHEIAKIRGDEVDLREMSLVVTGKGNKTAYLPLHQTVATFAHGFPDDGYWFQSYKLDDHMTASGVSKAIKSAMTRAGVNGTAHMLRHYFGSTLVQNGVDLRTVQELLRHESLATTQIYTRVTSKQRRDAIETLKIA